jgi:hypothetical protein
LGKLELENSRVDTREVASSRRLVLLGLKGKGVDVDTSSGNIGVVLIRLNKVEVRTKALLEAVVAIELKLGANNGVASSVTGSKTGVVGTTGGITSGKVGGDIALGKGTRSKIFAKVDTSIKKGLNLGSCDIKTTITQSSRNIGEGTSHMTSLNIGVNALSASGLNTVPVIPDTVDIIVIGVVVPLVNVGCYNSITLNNPDKLLNGVVKVKLALDVSVNGRLITSELKLLNQILVRALGESTSLIGIKVDVINKEGSSLERRNTEESVARTSRDRDTARVNFRCVGDTGNVAIRLGAKLKVDTDLMVLKGNKRKSQTRVSTEPELKRNVEGSGLSPVETGSGKGNSVTNHIVITNLETGLLGKLVPDGKPVTELLVDLLTTNVNGYVLDEDVANIVDPSEASRGRVGADNLGKSDLQVNPGDKITITRDGCGYSLTEIGRAGEGLFNRFHSKVGVASVYNLEKSNLRIARQVDILGTISYKLH